MGMNKHRVRDRKILFSIVEVMEVSECKEDFHTSDGNLSEDGELKVDAYGSPFAALDRAQDIARGGEALVVTDENIVIKYKEDFRVVLRVSFFNILFPRIRLESAIHLSRKEQ